MLKIMLVVIGLVSYVVAGPDDIIIDTSHGQSTQTGGENGAHQG